MRICVNNHRLPIVFFYYSIFYAFFHKDIVLLFMLFYYSTVTWRRLMSKLIAFFLIDQMLSIENWPRDMKRESINEVEKQSTCEYVFIWFLFFYKLSSCMLWKKARNPRVISTGSRGLNTVLKTSPQSLDRTRSDFVFKSELIEKSPLFFKRFYSFATNACDYLAKYIGYYDFRARLAHWKNAKRTDDKSVRQQRQRCNRKINFSFFTSCPCLAFFSVLCFTEVHVMAVH